MESVDDIKDEAERKRMIENEAVIESLYIMAVNAETAHCVHLLSGIKEDEYPQHIYSEHMIQKLVEKGHDRALAVRALLKNAKATVKDADEWIQSNKEWLEEDIKTQSAEQMGLQNESNTNAVESTLDEEDALKPLGKEEILRSKESLPNSWKLADRWSKFDDSGLRELTVNAVIGANAVNQSSGRDGMLEIEICAFYLVLNLKVFSKISKWSDVKHVVK